MDQIEAKLAGCFASVLPELSPDEIVRASAASVESWDSVATVTLIAVVEEEFGISIEVEDPAQFDSFQGFLNFVRKANASEQIAEDSA